VCVRWLTATVTVPVPEAVSHLHVVGAHAVHHVREQRIHVLAHRDGGDHLHACMGEWGPRGCIRLPNPLQPRRTFFTASFIVSRSLAASSARSSEISPAQRTKTHTIAQRARRATFPAPSPPRVPTLLGGGEVLGVLAHSLHGVAGRLVRVRAPCRQLPHDGPHRGGQDGGHGVCERKGGEGGCSCDGCRPPAPAWPRSGGIGRAVGAGLGVRGRRSRAAARWGTIAKSPHRASTSRIEALPRRQRTSQSHGNAEAAQRRLVAAPVARAGREHYGAGLARYRPRPHRHTRTRSHNPSPGRPSVHGHLPRHHSHRCGARRVVRARSIVEAPPLGRESPSLWRSALLSSQSRFESRAPRH